MDTRRRANRAMLAVVLVCAGLVAIMVVFPPERFDFYPRCVFHELTGLLCPGCGLTRALAALVGGRLVDAWRLNPLIFILLPAALGYLAQSYLRARRGARPMLSRVSPPAVYAALILAGVFTVIRNLP